MNTSESLPQSSIFDNAARQAVYNEPTADNNREEKGKSILQMSYDLLERKQAYRIKTI